MSSSERLLFLQGGRCFFCRQVVPPGEVSIEHLVASANGGSNAESNLVVCCRTLNQYLGSLPLKEKLRVIIGDGLPLRCPARSPNSTPSSPDCEPHVRPTPQETPKSNRKQPTAGPVGSKAPPSSQKKSAAAPPIVRSTAHSPAPLHMHDSAEPSLDDLREFHGCEFRAPPSNAVHPIPFDSLPYEQLGDSWEPHPGFISGSSPPPMSHPVGTPLSSNILTPDELERQIGSAVWRLQRTPPKRPTTMKKLRSYLRAHVVGARVTDQIDKLVKVLIERELVELGHNGTLIYPDWLVPVEDQF